MSVMQFLITLLICFSVFLIAYSHQHTIDALKFTQEENNQDANDQVIELFRQRRDAEQEVQSNNNAYMQAIRSLTLRDGTPLMFGQASFAPLVVGEQRPNLRLPSTFWTMTRDTAAPTVKTFSSADILCRKLRMC